MNNDTTRRSFLVQASVAGTALAGVAAHAAQADNETNKEKSKMANSKKILVAADP